MTQRVAVVLFVLYAVSLFLSIAAMEVFSSLLFVLALFAFLSNSMKSKHWSFSQLKLGPDLYLLSFFSVVLVGALFFVEGTKEKIDTIGYVRWVFLLYAFTYLLRQYVKIQRTEKVIWGLMGLAILVASYVIVQSLTGIDLIRPNESGIVKPMGGLYRAVGPFRLPLTFAYSFGTLGFIAFSYAFIVAKHRTRGVRTLSYICATMVLLALIASGVRGGWVGLMGAGLLLLSFKGKKAILTGLLLLTVMLGVLFVKYPGLQNRVASIADTQNSSNAGRFKIWRATIEIIKDNPVLGIGYNRVSEVIESYYDRLGIVNGQRGHAHNNYLQILASTGVLGFLAYLGFCLYFLVFAVQLYMHAPTDQHWIRGFALGAFCGQVFFHIGGLTECNFIDGEVNHALVFVWALLAAVAADWKTDGLGRIKSA